MMFGRRGIPIAHYRSYEYPFYFRHLDAFAKFLENRLALKEHILRTTLMHSYNFSGSLLPTFPVFLNESLLCCK